MRIVSRSMAALRTAERFVSAGNLLTSSRADTADCLTGGINLRSDTAMRSENGQPDGRSASVAAPAWTPGSGFRRQTDPAIESAGWTVNDNLMGSALMRCTRQ